MFQSVAHILFNTIQNYSEKDALSIKRDGQLQSTTYSQLGEQIRNLTHGLADVGLQAGDRIAILSNNMPEWTITDFAAFCLRAVVVPLYQTLPPSHIAYILKDSGARAVFLQNKMQYDKIAQFRNEVPTLEFVFSFELINESAPTFAQLLQRGQKHSSDHPDFFQQSMDAINPAELCSLVYTSGTTGEPKGVMLNHKGFVIDIINAEAVLKLYPDDVFLSFLPLSHLYERLAGHWCPMYRGATIHYAQSIDTVVQDIAEARPTVMVSVPRLYEKVAGALQDQVEHGSAFKRKLFNWALTTGLKYHRHFGRQEYRSCAY